MATACRRTGAGHANSADLWLRLSLSMLAACWTMAAWAGCRRGDPGGGGAAATPAQRGDDGTNDPADSDVAAADTPADPDQTSGQASMEPEVTETDPQADQAPPDDLLDDTPNADYLDGLTLAEVRAGGEVFLVWVADSPDERQRGLMWVTEQELAPLPDGRRRGMLFVWTYDIGVGFWMRNTITALDIAFIRLDGSIVTIHTMAPLDESTYPPDGPYHFALEVSAGTFAELGVEAGDLVEIP